MWGEWDIIVKGSGEEGDRQGRGKDKKTEAYAQIHATRKRTKLSLKQKITKQ